MANIPMVFLNSGRSMPVLGMGTAAVPAIPDADLVESAVVDAIELGYRYFDTAAVYGTEAPVGRAISRAIRNGLLRSRDEVFVTSKLSISNMERDLIVPVLRCSLRELGLEYVDLYLVHFPRRIRGDEPLMFTSEDVVHFDMKGVWEGMEECHRLGLAKSIGVSNFTCKKLELLLSHATVVPAVNQVEMHPVWQQAKLRAFCKEKGIHATAYSPFGGGLCNGLDLVLNSKEIKQVALARGMTPAQVCLRWAFEQGVSFVPKSFNRERLKQNMEIFDWELTTEDCDKCFRALPQRRLLVVEDFVTPNGNGPYKTLEDLWDGEL